MSKGNAAAQKSPLESSEASIKAVIFDVDGVLLDSMGIWNDLGARYLRGRGIDPEEGLNRILFSMSMEQGAAYLKEHYSLGISEAEILSGIEEMLRDYYFYEVTAKEGAITLLRGIADLGIPMIAATSSPREHITKALERVGLWGFLKGLLTTGEVGESKHSPRIYHLAAEQLGSDPSETLVFEDSLYALRTAKTAGFLTVGIFDANGEADQLTLKDEADLYVRNLADLEV